MRVCKFSVRSFTYSSRTVQENPDGDLENAKFKAQNLIPQPVNNIMIIDLLHTVYSVCVASTLADKLCNIITQSVTLSLDLLLW